MPSEVRIQLLGKKETVEELMKKLELYFGQRLEWKVYEDQTKRWAKDQDEPTGRIRAYTTVKVEE
jgi:hypothetical protein